MNRIVHFEIHADDPERAIAFICTAQVADLDATVAAALAAGGSGPRWTSPAHWARLRPDHDWTESA